MGEQGCGQVWQGCDLPRAVLHLSRGWGISRCNLSERKAALIKAEAGGRPGVWQMWWWAADEVEGRLRPG